MALGGAESKGGFAGQQPGPGEIIRINEADWEQESRGGVFEARVRGVRYGNGPAALVNVSFSSIGDRSLRVETERPLTIPHRA